MNSPLRYLGACLAAGLMLTGVLTLSSPGSAHARTTTTSGNLLVNPRATTGDTSAQGWDEVTIPGWRVTAGLPTVVRYGTSGFPRAAGSWPSSRGQVFAGGAGGTADLVQDVSLRLPSGQPAPGGTRYQVAAWLGGTSNSWADVTVRFLSAAGRVLGSRTIGSSSRTHHAGFPARSASGLLPAGAASAQVTLVLATSLTNYNGPNAPLIGYNRAVAADLGLSVSADVRGPAPLTPPTSSVPRYQHVFLFYFENEDYDQIIGNTKQAPYMNSLLTQGSVLGQFYAEEHPSDGNYLALAGGSTFGIPLDDPEEENSQYTIDSANIGDLVDSGHETWKTYLQSADGPCDDTVHGYYWDDDQPMMYFADVRDRPAYCADHVVPLEELSSDLASPATTPNFAWVSPDDCADMEGCGIKAGDEFLAQELGMIMNSPAWQTQRSLAIITFDEDNTDYQHPAQRVPTIILGSAGVRRGYVSSVRYTHYSLLRTIEGALGLGTLTANDRFAQPVNDVFAPAASGATVPEAAQVTAARETAARETTARETTARETTQTPVSGQAGRSSGPLATRGSPEAWVANYASASVTPVNLTTRKVAKPIAVGADPRAVAATPNGKTVYVANSGSGTVTPISTATGEAGPPIPVGADPWAIAVTPDGKTAYVTNSGSGTVTPINTATDQPGQPIPVGANPQAIAVTPNGRTAYVLDWGAASVTPIDTVTGRALPPVQVGSFPFAIAISPDGRTAYVANYGSDTVTPIAVATNRAGRSISAGYVPNALAITPNGRAVYAVDGDSDSVTPIAAATGRAGRAIPVGYSPVAIGISGSTAYVVSVISGTVTPISTVTGRAGRALSVGLYSYPTALAFAGPVAVVVDTYGDQVSLINTRTQHVYAPITVGNYPAAVAISG
jgi:YVTN family beta-propeller protein